MDWKSSSIPTWGCFLVAVITGSLMVIWRVHDKGGAIPLGGWTNNLSLFVPTLIIAGAVVGAAVLNYKAHHGSPPPTSGSWKARWQRLQWANAERERLEAEVKRWRELSTRQAQPGAPFLARFLREKWGFF